VGLRPACNLASNTLVSDNPDSDGCYTLVLNRSPSISGGDGDLGTLTDSFTLPLPTYQVSDPDPGDTLTVEERIDNTQIRAPFAAAQNTDIVPEYPSELYKKLPNGEHTFSIKATDSSGASATRTYSFTKAVNVAEMRLAEPLPADDMPTAAALNVQGSFPVGSILEAWISNNANDEEPYWQDVSNKLNTGKAIILTNNDKTADDWGIGIRVKLSRNGAVGDCYISGVSGGYR
jgi:hypothetical protein